jgi:hypothetical protein
MIIEIVLKVVNLFNQNVIGSCTLNFVFYGPVSYLCKIIVLTAILYGCKMWSLTARKEHRLRAPDNRVGLCEKK